MLIEVLQAKIHNVRITQTELNYTGSITMDMDLVDEAGMIPNQKVLIVNNNNGERFETYIIEGDRGSGVICTNGAAAHCARKGDCLIIVAFLSIENEKANIYKPKLVYVDQDNKRVDAELIDKKLVKILG